MQSSVAARESSMGDGLEISDLRTDVAFAARAERVRDLGARIEAVHRLTEAILESPEMILQRLVNAAIDLCGADSAGISIERVDKAQRTKTYEWVATAGTYSRFLNAFLPEAPSACGLCLELWEPQLLRVSQPFFERIGVEAEDVTDGILLPWRAGEERGTIWILAHGRREAFDHHDWRVMQSLGELAAMGVRKRQETILMLQQQQALASQAALDLSRMIKAPLQAMRDTLYLAERSKSSVEAKMLAEEITGQLKDLSGAVRKLVKVRLPDSLTLPV